MEQDSEAELSHSARGIAFAHGRAAVGPAGLAGVPVYIYGHAEQAACADSRGLCWRGTMIVIMRSHWMIQFGCHRHNTWRIKGSSGDSHGKSARSAASGTLACTACTSKILAFSLNMQIKICKSVAIRFVAVARSRGQNWIRKSRSPYGKLPCSECHTDPHRPSTLTALNGNAGPRKSCLMGWGSKSEIMDGYTLRPRTTLEESRCAESQR